MRAATLGIAAALAATGAAAEDTAWSGRASLLAAYERGNAESDRLYSDGELAARSAASRLGASAKYDRRASPGEGVSVAWRAAGNYDRFVAERRFVYGRAALEHDPPKDIDLRSSAGAGYGAELRDGERTKLALRGGLDYVVVERIETAAERYPAMGWGLKAEWRAQGATLRLFHEQEGFWNLRDLAQVSLRTRSGVRVPLVERLSATTQLNLDWERRPAPGRKATDTTLLLGVDYAW